MTFNDNYFVLERNNTMFVDLSVDYKIQCPPAPPPGRGRFNNKLRTVCFASVLLAFAFGLIIGVLIPFICLNNYNATVNNNGVNSELLKSIFVNNSYSKTVDKQYSTVTFVETEDIRKTSENKRTSDNNGVIVNGVYWGEVVEKALPEGFGTAANQQWTKYVRSTKAVKLETGCGRMQNRMLTFKDGSKACVRYRQNTDQIQGEVFSFYLAQILKLPNLAPSTVSIVDLKEPLWRNLANQVSASQWNSNRPVVLTKFISNLDNAHIPNLFKPVDRHLNKFDVLKMFDDSETVSKNSVSTTDAQNEVQKNNDVPNVDSSQPVLFEKKSDDAVNVSARPILFEKNSKILDELVTLAQWSDLIIFDYLTANLDRIVNNLYNYQWNANIMEAPAHNLARKIDSNLLVFLDNESGLLHGYRLLKKYEIYHAILLDNLCLFRKNTVDVIKQLKVNGNIGQLLKDMFEKQNSDKVKDVLPTLPDKSIKILNDRINRVYNQISKCESMYFET